MGVFLLELAAGLGDAVDGGEDLAFVLEVGVGEAGQIDLLALEVGVEVDEGGLVGFEDGVHAALLIGVEAEFAGGAVVIPPAAAKT